MIDLEKDDFPTIPKANIFYRTLKEIQKEFLDTNHKKWLVVFTDTLPTLSNDFMGEIEQTNISDALNASFNSTSTTISNSEETQLALKTLLMLFRYNVNLIYMDTHTT
jgi:hypothetical protein